MHQFMPISSTETAFFAKLSSLGSIAAFYTDHDAEIFDNYQENIISVIG